MNSNNRTDQPGQETLVRLASRGDLDAFNQLVLMYQDMVYSQAYALLGEADSAEDAAQESFIKAFENIGNYRGGSFRAWLLRIVTNSAYDLLRHSRRRPAQPLFPADENGEEVESPAWLADPAASVETMVLRHENAERLSQMLDELPEVFRSVITLIDIQELDYTEAAQVLKVPMGTVKSRLARARLQMKTKLLGVSERANDLSGGSTRLPEDCLYRGQYQACLAGCAGVPRPGHVDRAPMA